MSNGDMQNPRRDIPVESIKAVMLSESTPWHDIPKAVIDSPGSVLVVLLGAIYSIMKLRRRQSRDNVEVVKDRAESNLIDAYQKDREALVADRDAAVMETRQAWTEHNKVSIENASIKSENFYLKQEIERLKLIVQDMQETFSREQLRWETERVRLDERFEEVRSRLQALSLGSTGYTGPAPLAGA